MPQQETQPDPSAIISLSTAYWGAQTLLTANRIGLFEFLGESAYGLDEVAQGLGTDRRATRLLVNACIGLGLVTRVDDQYQNSPQSQAFLCPGKPGFLGNALRYSDDLYPVWTSLEQTLKSGQPALPTADYTGDDEERTRHFVHGMHNRALGIGRLLVRLVDLADRASMIDVGGGPGTYSCLFARAYPRLKARVLDLPGVVRVADEIIAEMGLPERVTAAGFDYLQDEFPGPVDVVLISGVFHRESEATCRQLIAQAADSLVPGGVLIISDVFTDAGGAQPAFATLFGLNMMITAPDGGVHADADVARWMQEAGFTGTDIRHFPPPMPHRMVIGEKS